MSRKKNKELAPRSEKQQTLDRASFIEATFPNNFAGGFTIRSIAPAEIESAVRDGRAPVVVEAGAPPVYHFDEARPESQAARLAVDAALQKAAGRADVFTAAQQPVESIGSRYVDWLVRVCSA